MPDALQNFSLLWTRGCHLKISVTAPFSHNTAFRNTVDICVPNVCYCSTLTPSQLHWGKFPVPVLRTWDKDADAPRLVSRICVSGFLSDPKSQNTYNYTMDIFFGRENDKMRKNM